MSTCYKQHEEDVLAALAGTEGKWSILVYCQQPSHERRDVTAFRINVDPPGGIPPGLRSASISERLPFWDAADWFVSPQGDERQRRRRDRRPTRQFMLNDRPVGHRHFVSDWSKVDTRYPLRCRKCDLSIPRRRRAVRSEDDLQIALDKLAMIGRAEVSLSELEAIVKMLHS
jgi:hypothetical protein